MLNFEEHIKEAVKAINLCEKQLDYILTNGEIRDFIKDNFIWSSSYCEIIANTIFYRRR